MQDNERLAFDMLQAVLNITYYKSGKSEVSEVFLDEQLHYMQENMSIMEDADLGKVKRMICRHYNVAYGR